MFPLLLALAGPAQAASQPHVIVVVWDAARPANMGVYGYERETTPNIDAWAQTGSVFDNAQSTSMWNVPAVAGLFTGLFAHNHKVDYDADRFTLDLRTDVHTLAESLKEAGYATGLFSSQGGYVKKKGFNQGFDEMKHLGQDKLLEKGLEFIDAHTGDPTFTVLHWMDPHPPYDPPDEWDPWSDPNSPEVLLGSRDEPGWYKPYRINTAKDVLSDAEWRRLVAQYDGEVLSNDYQFGRLLDALSDRKMRDNTIVVFTASHGEGLGEHSDQLVWHDYPYESVLDVPLVISGPGVPAGRVQASVRTIDIYPTLLDLTDATVPHALNGASLLPLMKGQAEDKPRINLGTSHFLGAPIFWRGEKWKHFELRKGQPMPHFFDLTDDPREQNNRASETKLIEAVKSVRDTYIAETTINP